MRPADGSLAVLIGDTDITAMLMVEAANVSYTSRLPLPVGESDVSVWLVLTGNHQRDGRLPRRPGADCDLPYQASRRAGDSGLKFNCGAT